MIYEECSVEVTGGYVLIAIKIPIGHLCDLQDGQERRGERWGP